MTPERPLRHFGFALLAAFLLYLIGFWTIELVRGRKGPWDVTFIARPGQSHRIIINQQKLGIRDVSLVFTGTANVTNEVVDLKLRFKEAKPVPFELPFGMCIFQDTTFLPGTVTMRLYGHEIELLPRTLIVDHAEHAWKPGSESVLPARGPR